ncbi:MAG: hypothetical protein JSV34_05775 [Candidatus Omnitrophota bacterium]|nr:MAG: hypothetical protein JSV34_05775 [Candidatus Omnitrophota bacterium]
MLRWCTRRVQRFLVSFVALATVFGSAPSTSGTTIRPRFWEELVFHADFVGIVECTTAGGVVARYKVVECWKGDLAPSTVISIRVPPDYWGPRFPVALCEEQYLVTAFKKPPSFKILSYTQHGPVPLWWRDIPADYSAPLFQGWAKLPLGNKLHGIDPFGPIDGDWKTLRRDFQEFTALPPSQQEARLLKRIAREYFTKSGEEKDEYFEARAAEVLGKLGRVDDVDDVLDELLRATQSDSTLLERRARGTLMRGGGSVTLKVLEAPDGPACALDKVKRDEICQQIRKRLTHSAPKPHPEKPEPTREKLDQLRASLTAEDPLAYIYEVCDILARYDPAPVARFLVQWENPCKSWSDDDERFGDEDLGYVIGSQFARNCGQDRVKNLRMLLTARDDYVRVAGATYLCFEDEREGIAHLKRFAELRGDPGVWAALDLARRGHKDFVSRALEALADVDHDIPWRGRTHRQSLQDRIKVLLSNSAEASGLPQPAPPTAPPADVHRYYADWWKAHREPITLSDPWFAVLAEQKVD